MARKYLAGLTCTALFLVTTACQFLGRQNPVIPAATVTPTEAPAPTASPTVDIAATAQAVEALMRITEEARSAAATVAAEEKATRQAEIVQSRTADAAVQATRQAEGMFQVVETLQTEGILEDTTGKYYRIEDFEESWAQIDWYQWWPTGYSPTNFVVRAHSAWESGSRTANWFSSGCGFVFRERDVDNHYMIYMGLDGYVYLKGYVDGAFRELGREYVGKIDHLKGEADIMLVVNGDRIVYFINGEQVFQRTNDELIEGDLALTLISGTNKDFGTRCAMSGIELWDLDGP